MTLAAARQRALETTPATRSWQIARSPVLVAVGLFTLAAAVRLWAVGLIRFPMAEGSAYYVDVARNLVTGRGLVIDAIWSYSTPPLILPRPAFELWQPMASLLAALPMAALGSTFDAARASGIVLGALLAPLAWFVARDAAHRLEMTGTRAAWIAFGAGLLTAVAGPLLFATAVPDSALPFTLLAVAACAAMPAAVAGDRRAIVGLGVLIGLAYLTRMEAVWLGLAFTLFVWRSYGFGAASARRVIVTALIAGAVAAPWLLRNVSVFGTPFPGQLADNLFLTRNEQIFAWADPPTLAGFLAQGAPTIVGNVLRATWHDAVNVLLIPAAPVVIAAAITIGALAWRGRRSASAVLGRSPLAALLVSGAITFAATSVLFPVATLWGTFEHASGPLLIGLVVMAVLGGDAFVAWLVRKRDWQRANAWLAPLALAALTVPLSLLQLGSAARQATQQSQAVDAVAQALPDHLDSMAVPAGTPVISDHPVWVADALGRPGLALPDEPVSSVLDLARTFGARAVVVLEQRGNYPAVLETGQQACFSSRFTIGEAAVFVIDRECIR